MTPKAFKDFFVFLFKLYNDLKVDFELTIGEQVKTHFFFNIFSNDPCNMFVQQQKQYYTISMNEFINFFQICHSIDQPVDKQHKCEDAKKRDCIRWLTKRRMLPTRNAPLLATKTLQATTMNTIPNILVRKTSAIHVKVMDVTCCGNPVLVTTAITQTVAKLLDLPPIALNTEPLKID